MLGCPIDGCENEYKDYDRMRWHLLAHDRRQLAEALMITHASLSDLVRRVPAHMILPPIEGPV